MIERRQQSTLKLLLLLAVLLLATLGDLPQGSALTRVSSLTLNPQENLVFTGVIDPSGTFAYYGTDTDPGIIVKVRLSDLTRVGSTMIQEGPIHAATIDPSGQYAYFGTDTSPGVIVKIRLSDLERVGNLTLGPGENSPLAATVDPTGTFAYFGTETAPGIIVRVRLSDFTLNSTLVLGAGDDRPDSAFIDPTSSFLYLPTFTSPGRLVQVRLSNFSESSALTLNTGEDSPFGNAFDFANGYAYLGTFTKPALVVRIRLPSLTRVDAISLPAQSLRAASLDTTTGSAYFGQDDGSGGVLVKVRLSNFTTAEVFTLGAGETYIFSALSDPGRHLVYVGLRTSPSIVVKIDDSLPITSSQTISMQSNATISTLQGSSNSNGIPLSVYELVGAAALVSLILASFYFLRRRA